MSRILTRNPVEVHTGYLQEPKNYFDIFLTPSEEVGDPLPSQYKKLRARLEKNSPITILLTKSQVQALGGLHLEKKRPEILKEKIFNNKPVLYYSQYLEIMFPVRKVSESSILYRYQHFVRGIEVIDDDQSLGNAEDIIVGDEFLSQFKLSNGRDSTKLYSMIIDEEDVEPWGFDINNLGVFEYMLNSHGMLLKGGKIIFLD